MDQILVAALTVISSVIVAVITVGAQQRRDANAARTENARLQEEIEDKLWTRARNEINSLREELEREREQRRALAQRVEELEQELTEERKRNRQLEEELARYGRKPL